MNVNGIGMAGCPAWYEKRKTDGGRRAGSSTKEDFGEKVKEAERESETHSEIVVKPDGSKVLVMKISVGGTETNMSLEISKPTKAPNENARQEIRVSGKNVLKLTDKGSAADNEMVKSTPGLL